MTIRSSIALIALGLTLASNAFGDSDRAEALFQEARRLLDADEYDAACQKLEESQKLDPGAGTLALLAYCHEMQGRTATAHSEYGKAMELAKQRGDLERAKTIEQQRDRLAPKLSSLRLVVRRPAEGLRLVRNGKLVDRSEWNRPISVNPGSFSVEASAPGRRSWTATVSVGSDGSRVEVEIPPLGRDSVGSAESSNTPVWIALGVGVVGVGVGSFFGLRAKSLNDESNDQSHCNGNICDRAGYDKRKDAQRAALVSTIAFGVGAAGLATSVVLWLTRSKSEAVRARPIQRGAWAGFERRF